MGVGSAPNPTWPVSLQKRGDSDTDMYTGRMPHAHEDSGHGGA